MANKLTANPCKCGSTKLRYVESMNGTYHIYCADGVDCNKLASAYSRDMAIRLWNKRNPLRRPHVCVMGSNTHRGNSGMTHSIVRRAHCFMLLWPHGPDTETRTGRTRVSREADFVADKHGGWEE